MEQVNVMLEPLRLFLAQVSQFVPKLAIAIVILVAGWLLAKLVRLGLRKALKAINFHVLTERAGIDGGGRRSARQTRTMAAGAGR